MKTTIRMKINGDIHKRKIGKARHKDKNILFTDNQDKIGIKYSKVKLFVAA